MLDDWQSWFLEHALSKRSDGRWSAFEVGLIVPRQNGKGALLEARQLAGLFLLDEPLQVHSAHEFKTAFEHFLRIVNLVEGCPDLDRRVQRIRRGAGEQAIELKNGNRLRFLARSTGSGRGLTGDTIYLDEAFALTDAMMGALLPTLSAVPNPQVWYTSSAPRANSDVLHSLRQRGREGVSPRLFFAEWGLETGVAFDDPENWRRTNPALGIRITEEFVEAELAAMASMPEEFGRERLGIADVPEAEATVVDMDLWGSLEDRASEVASQRQWALAVSPDRMWAALAGAGRRADGLLHVETVWGQPRTDWVKAEVVKRFAAVAVPLRIPTGTPAAAFIDPLRELGVEVVEVPPTEHAEAIGQFLMAVNDREVRHLGQTSLTSALRAAAMRPSGDVDMWAPRKSSGDITPLVAVTVALGGVPAPASAGPAAYVDMNDWDWDEE